jgi:hypothetical protein
MDLGDDSQGKWSLQRENDVLKCEIASLRADKSALIQRLHDRHDHLQKICCSTPLSHQYYVSMRGNAENESLWWPSWCPNCWRPVDISVCDFNESETQQPAAPGETLPFSRGRSTCSGAAFENPRYAYVAVIWGDHPGFILGALVLGHSLKQKSSGGLDRVLLHTSDVGEVALECLRQVWTLKQVDYLDACERCFYGGSKSGRFSGTFTKLHAIGLTKYDKVLLLDLDIVVLEDIDHLFDLRAPAALARGANDKAHGVKVDGRKFFLGGHVSTSGDANQTEWCWAQCGGINAGVVLLEPCKRLYEQTCSDILQDLHPAHIPGAGPEQDYLSRLYAPYWTHISVKYNYQLHHILYNLESVLEWWSGNPGHDDCLPARLKMRPDTIAVIHFSGHKKMWDREYCITGEPADSDEDFARKVFERSDPQCFERWVQRTAAPDDYARHNIVVETRPDGGKRFRAAASKKDLDEASGDWIGRQDVESLISKVVELAGATCLHAVTHWREDLECLLSSHPSLGGSVPNLLEKLGKAASPAGSAFWVCQTIETYWETDGMWYPAVITKVHSDGRVNVRFVQDSWSECTIKCVGPRHVRIPDLHS